MSPARPPNQEMAFKYYLLSANQGYTGGHNNVGHAYHHGIGVPQNLEKAIYHYSVAARQGDGPALRNLGYIYYEGLFGVTKDVPKASEYLTKAANTGDAVAKGLCCEYGINRQKDGAQALLIYLKDVSMHNPRIVSQYLVGRCYANGVGTAVDMDKALEYWSAAAARRHFESIQELTKIKLVNQQQQQQQLQLQQQQQQLLQQQQQTISHYGVNMGDDRVNELRQSLSELQINQPESKEQQQQHLQQEQKNIQQGKEQQQQHLQGQETQQPR